MRKIEEILNFFPQNNGESTKNTFLQQYSDFFFICNFFVQKVLDPIKIRIYWLRMHNTAGSVLTGLLDQGSDP